MSMDLLSVEMLLCFCIIPFKRTEELFTELEATDSIPPTVLSILIWIGGMKNLQYSQHLYLLQRENTSLEYESVDWCMMCDESVCMVFKKCLSTL